MEGALLIAVLTSVFLLHAGADIPIQSDFDIQKVAGKWYPSALVVDKAETFPADPAHQVVVPSENGDLLFRYTFMKEGKCETREVPLHHTDEPGKFLSRDRTSTLRMVDVDYDSYYILHVEMQNAAALHLFTRKQNGIVQEEEKFKKVAESMGFEVHQNSFLKKASCPV